MPLYRYRTDKQIDDAISAATGSSLTSPVPVADGGTGATDAATARTNLGLAIGTDVQAYDADLATWAGLTPSANAQSLVTAANYAAMRALLDLEAGTDFYSIAAADAAFLSQAEGDAAYQPLDADLTTWAGLTPSANAQSLVTAANYAAMRALLDLEAGTDFYSKAAADAAFQPLDGDLTSIAALTTTAYGRGLLELADETALEAVLDTLPNLTSIQGRTVTLADAGANAIFGWDDTAGAYENLTAAEATAVINAFVGDSGSGGTKGAVPAPASGDSTKFLKGDGTWGAIPGGGDALKADPLSQFAATTSLQLKGVISDETGSGALVFADTPTLVTPILGTPTSGTLSNCTAATDAARGVVELATTGEVETGTDTARAVTAAGVQAHWITRGQTDVLYSAALNSGTGLDIDIATGSWASGATYDEIQVIFHLVSNSGTSGIPTLALSDDSGSTYGAAQNISVALSNAAFSWNIVATIHNAGQSATTKIITVTHTSGATSAVIVLTEATKNGVTNGLRIGVTAGAYDGSGSLYVLGKNRMT